MSSEITVAIISALAVIIAAIVTGIFSIAKRKGDNKEASTRSPQQTVQAGSNAIVARDGAVQNVSINSQLPLSPSPWTLSDSQKLLEVTDQITNRASEILEDNEKVLSSLFRDNPNRTQIRDNMMDLFTIQRSRASFGEWKAFLESMTVAGNNPEITEILKELVEYLEDLHDTLYSYSRSSETRARNVKLLELFTKDQLFTKKQIVTMVLDDENRTLQELQSIANDYLEYLRELTENIGRINGQLKAIIH